MITKGELQRIEGKCRARLKKQGYNLQRQRDTHFYFNVENARYRITTGKEATPPAYTLKLNDIMAAAGL